MVLLSHSSSSHQNGEVARSGSIGITKAGLAWPVPGSSNPGNQPPNPGLMSAISTAAVAAKALKWNRWKRKKRLLKFFISFPAATSSCPRSGSVPRTTGKSNIVVIRVRKSFLDRDRMADNAGVVSRERKVTSTSWKVNIRALLVAGLGRWEAA